VIMAVPARTVITNTAQVSSSFTPDPHSLNNSLTIQTPVP
jgi:hypothetical protein